jgi:hypothetical protein
VNVISDVESLLFWILPLIKASRIDADAGAMLLYLKKIL